MVDNLGGARAAVNEVAEQYHHRGKTKAVQIEPYAVFGLHEKIERAVKVTYGIDKWGILNRENDTLAGLPNTRAFLAAKPLSENGPQTNPLTLFQQCNLTETEHVVGQGRFASFDMP